MMKKVITAALLGVMLLTLPTACVKETIEKVTVKRGTKIWLNAGTPALDTGRIGDYYIDRLTGLLYGPKAETGWIGTPIRLVSSHSLEEPNTIHSGATRPATTIGKIGDLYIDTQAVKLYGPKTAQGWGQGVEIGGVPQTPPNDLPNYRLSEDGTTLLAWFNTQTLFIDMRTDSRLNKVTEIAAGAFRNELEFGIPESYAVRSLIINRGVKKIGMRAFSGLQYLEAITLPGSLRKIERGILTGCERLKYINLEDGIEEIGEFAFVGCIAESIKIPHTVKKIGRDAFHEWKNITELKLPEGVEQVDSNAFAFCTSLKVIDLPASLGRMGSNTPFERCSNVQSVIIRSKTPPAYPAYHISFGNRVNIYVPDESIETYKNSDWASYLDKTKIKPLSSFTR